MALLRSALAIQLISTALLLPVSADKPETDSGCSAQEDKPAIGDALLQLDAKKLHHVAEHEKFGAQPTLKTEGDFFANAYDRFDKAFCGGGAPTMPKHTSLIDEFDLGQYPSMSADLNQAGFEKVKATNSAKEMATYIRRVASSCNMKVVDEGGLNGASEWFSNETAKFTEIKQAMFKSLLASSKEFWVSVNPKASVTGTNAPLDLVGFVQVRALRSKEQTTKFVRRIIEKMGLKIIDEGGFDGVMGYYADPWECLAFPRLIPEIQRAAIDHTWAEMSSEGGI